jgi:hypothetical protein
MGEQFEETQGLTVRKAGAQLEFHRTARGLVIRVLAVGNNRLQINSVFIEAKAQALIVGPAGSAFWETLQPAGRPARSVEGLAFTYDAGEQALTLQVWSHRGNQVLLNGRALARLELRVIGPAAGEIWTALQWKPGAEEDPFADFRPTPSDL